MADNTSRFTATPAITVTSPCANPPDGALIPLSTVPCTGQNILSAPISNIYKKPLLNRMRAISVRGGSESVLRWQMHDQEGNPVNLTECADPGSSESLGSSCIAPYALKVRVRENLSVGRSVHDITIFEVDALIYDAEQGIIQAQLLRKHTELPGVFFAEVALVGETEDEIPVEFVLFSNIFYLYIDRSMWSKHGPSGPPSLSEVRLHLRDSGSAENFLLDNLKFDNAEIAMAASNVVAYWNEIPPPIGTFTTRNFPFRYHWLQGICAQLFMLVAEQFRSNNLQYSAAGVSVNDQDKMQVYEQAAMARNQEWKDFVRRKKSEINLEMCYGEVGSGYAHYGYGRHIDGNVVGR